MPPHPFSGDTPPRRAAAGEAVDMQVVECGPGDVTMPARRPVPTPAAGEVLLATRWCGLCGTDLFKLAGDDLVPGTVLGHELVGEVAAIGPRVEGFARGDRVVVPHHVACGVCSLCRRGADTQCAMFRENLMDPGGFAEYVLIRERAVRLAARRLPDTLADEAAVFMEPAACVLRGVRHAALPPEGGCAVVAGAGAMGLLHLLVLRATNPGLAVAVSDPVEERLHAARNLGAAIACAPGAELARGVAGLTDGLGADASFDTVGGAPVLSELLGVVRPGGTAVLFAHGRPGERAGFDVNPFFKHEQRVIGTYSGGLAEQQEAFALLASGRLDPTPLVTHRLPFSETAAAVRLARRREALKILLGPDLP